METKKSRIILIGIIFSFLLTTVVVCGQQIDDAENYLREGAEFENHSYFDRALQSYGKALEVDQGNLEAIAGINRVIKKQSNFYLEFGKLHGKKGEIEKAIEYYKKAVETNPNNTEARKALRSAISQQSDFYLEFGKLYEEKGEIEKAIEYYKKAVETNPNSTAAWETLERISEQSKFQQFIGILAKLWDVKLPLAIAIVLSYVIPKKWRERRKKKTTIEPFENFPVEKNRGVDQGKMLSQLVIEKLHEKDRGVYAPKITEPKPLLPPEGPKELKIISGLIDWFSPPNITKVTGRYQKSKSKEIGITVQLINTKTNKIEYVKTLWKKGNESEQNDWEPLAEDVAYWILFCESEDKPKDFQSFCDVQKGDQLFSIEDFDSALNYYKKAIESEKDYAKAYHNKGFIYELNGDYTNAIKSYNRAIEFKHKNPYVTYFNLGNVYRYCGNKENKDDYFKKSIESFEKAIKSIPADGPNKRIKESTVNVAKACTYLLMNSGEQEKAKRIIDREEYWISLIKKLGKKKIEKIKGPSIVYLLANYYSLASGILAKTDTQKNVEKSIKYLKEAIRRKKYLRIMAKGDLDFKYIKQEAEFKKLMLE